MKKNIFSWGKTIFSLLLGSTLAFTACTDKEDVRIQDRSQLDIKVKVQPASRAMVTGETLPNGESIGVSVTNADGSAYDGQTACINIAYKAVEVDGVQEWKSTAPIQLSSTEGKMYAYYPYAAGKDYTAIPVDITEQTDWMFAEPCTVDNLNSSAEVILTHAQTAINVNVVRDASYTGSGAVSALSVTSEALATSAKLDARDGTYSNVIGTNTAISILPEAFTLATAGKSQENIYMFIPAADVKKDFTVTATIDGKQYNTVVAMDKVFAPGTMYKVNVKITNAGLVVDETVTLTKWGIKQLAGTNFEPLPGEEFESYADYMQFTYNVTDISQPTDIFNSTTQNGYSFDINTVSEMRVLENSSLAGGEPIVVTPAYQYTFSSVGEHTVYVKFDDMTILPAAICTFNSNLVNVKIPDSVEKIGEFSFANCKGLTEIVFPESVKEIGLYAFIGCSGLTGELVIPDACTSIGYYAFYQCKGLTSLDLGNGIREIKDLAFHECTGLTGELVIPNSVTSIGSAFNGCAGLTSLKLGSGITTIGWIAFYGCKGLTSITIPNSVTSIGAQAFWGCEGLTEVTIPESVTEIGNWAFEGCTGLKKITSLATTAPSIENETFKDVKTEGTLYVSAGSTGYDAWMQTTGYYLGKYNWTKVEQ